MYTSFYNLSKKPFEMNPELSFLWLGKSHEKAFSVLQYGIRHNNGLLLLSGDAGTGKTLLVKAFIQSLGKDVIGAGDVEYAAIWDPGLERIDFYNSIARGFGLKAVFTSKVEFLLQFSQFLHEAARKNKKVLLLVDDCHLLSQEMLEELRLLSNIEKSGAKLINIFFVGRPEFDDMLLQQKNRALRQRLTVSAEINSLTIEETDNYIHHRLKIAGTEAPLFVAEAVQAIHRFSLGIPFHINAICDHVLENGSIQGMRTIDRKLVEKSIQGMDLPEGLLYENQPDYSREHKDESFSKTFKSESQQPSLSFSFESLKSVLKSDDHREWFNSGFWLEKFRTFKELKGGIGFGRLAGLMVLLVLFAMGIMFLFSAPHSQESDLQSPIEIADDTGISEDNKQSEIAAERVESPENIIVPRVPILPGVKGEFDIDTQSIASAPEEDDIENITENQVQIKPSSLDDTNGYGGEKEIEDLNAEETITELTFSDETDQSEPIPPADSQDVVKIERSILKKILDQQEAAGELPMEPRKIILGLRSGSASLTGDGLRTLLNFIEKLEQYPNARLEVKGFVSSKSNTPENIKMSKERALNVQKLLLEKGIDAKRIEVVGMGNQEPIASNDTAEGRAKNRRVEVSIIDDGVRE